MAFIGLKFPQTIGFNALFQHALVHHHATQDRLPLAPAWEFEDPKDYHVTCVYLGKGLDWSKIEEILNVIVDWAKDQQPFMAYINRTTTFPAHPTDKTVPWVGCVDAPELFWMQRDLMRVLDENRIAFDDKWPVFRPHVTLAYAASTSNPDSFEAYQAPLTRPLNWLVDEVTVYAGEQENQWGHFTVKLGPTEAPEEPETIVTARTLIARAEQANSGAVPMLPAVVDVARGQGGLHITQRANAMSTTTSPTAHRLAATYLQRVAANWADKNPGLRNRLSRAIGLVEHVTPITDHVFEVQGSELVPYVVVVKGNTSTCTCADAENGHHCKHRLATALYCAQQRRLQAANR